MLRVHFGILLMIALPLLVLIICLLFSKKKNLLISNEGRFYIVLTFACIISLTTVSPSIILVSPGEIGVVYDSKGFKRTIESGYNYIEPGSEVSIIDTRMNDFNFGYGFDVEDEKYGSLTKDGKFIGCETSMCVQIDSDNIRKYYELFGPTQVTSDKIQKLLRERYLHSINETIINYTREEVMNNKRKIQEEVLANFKQAIKGLPINVYDSMIYEFYPQ